MHIILLIFAREKYSLLWMFVSSVWALFVGDKEVCQLGGMDLQLRCYSMLFGNSFCYRMCVVIYVYYLVSMMLATGFPSEYLQCQNTSKRDFQVVTVLPGFLGHAYDMMVSNTDKNEWSSYMLFGDVYSKLDWLLERKCEFVVKQINLLGCIISKWHSAELQQVLRYAFWFGKKKKYQH